MDRLQNITKWLIEFRDKREWKPFHNPKSLAMSIAMEASELMEFFQWKDMEESEEVAREKKDKIKSEIADVGIYLLFFCEHLGIDLIDAMEEKMKLNEKRYSIEKSKGNAKKYTEFE
jgi:NTP pyrophosphatase (non-canonical NTP hydrolase)